MKIIKKKSVVPLPPTTGSITDTFNIQDQITNAPSLRLTKHMMGIPTDGIIPFEGDEIPEGYEEIGNPNLEVYSTEEQVIGTWLGKPLYRKMFIIENLPDSTYQYIDGYDVSICKFKKGYGIMYPNDSDEIIYSIPRTGTYNAFIAQDATGLYIQTDFKGTDIIAELAIEYTKTTD